MFGDEVQLDPAAPEDHVVPFFGRRPSVLEAEPFVERQRLSQVAARKDRDGVLRHAGEPIEADPFRSSRVLAGSATRRIVAA